MAVDASLRYRSPRQARALTDREQARLRQLAGRTGLSATESYEFGALKGRARHSPDGRRLLDDIAHADAARRTPGRPVSTSVAGRMVADAIARALQDAEED